MAMWAGLSLSDNGTERAQRRDNVLPAKLIAQQRGVRGCPKAVVILYCSAHVGFVAVGYVFAAFGHQ